MEPGEDKPKVDSLTVKMGEKKWCFQYVTGMEDLGSTHDPKRRNRKIQILVGQQEKEELDTLIHECLHAAMFLVSEHTVATTAAEITELLWALGWRRDTEKGLVFNVQQADLSDDDPCEVKHK